MILVKFSGPEASRMKAAARALEESKRAKNKLQKLEDSAKEDIAKQLWQLRQINLDCLPGKETVFVQCEGEDAVKIEIKESDRFDASGFRLLHPELNDQFTRPVPAKYFDSLLK